MLTDGNYLKTLRERAKKSRIHNKFQLDGLEIAALLGDGKHKALYIKLAKQGNAQRLRELAASVAQLPNIKNKGAFFMYALSNLRGTKKPNTLPEKRKNKAKKRRTTTARRKPTHG